MCRAIDQVEPVLTFIQADLEVDGSATGTKVIDTSSPLDVVDTIGCNACNRGVYAATSPTCAGGHQQVVPVAHDCVIQDRGRQANIEAVRDTPGELHVAV